MIIASEEFELSFTNGVEGLSWTATSHFKSQVSWMTVMWQTLSVSKEVFNLISRAKIAAVGIDTKIYRRHETRSYKSCSRARTTGVSIYGF